MSTIYYYVVTKCKPWLYSPDGGACQGDESTGAYATASGVVGGSIVAGTPERTIRRDYVGPMILLDNAVERILIPGGYIDGEGRYRFYLTDYQGNNRAVVDQQGAVVQRTDYYPYGLPLRQTSPDAQPYKYSGKEFDPLNGLNTYDFHARAYHPATILWQRPDPIDFETPYFSPLVFCNANPVNYFDDDGEFANGVAALVFGGVGMIVGASLEIGTQLISTGSVENWSAVAGSAVQGGLTGAAAGLTCGASLMATAATSAAANAAGGFINREIQGKETTGTDVAVDAALGLATGVGSKYLGKAVEKGLDGLSNQAKGKLGETITEIKYTVRGYKKVGDNPKGNAKIRTGEKTPLGNDKEAHYDFGFTHRITGKKIIVESKYNSSGFTKNQNKALKNVTVDFKVDRTTSKMIGNWATSGFATQWGSYNAQAN